jgi:tetratricopeptide (TPR) repeat protein
VHASPSAKRRFEREIELAAQLKHANIIAVFQSGLTSDGRQFCAMDYVRGLRLDEYVVEKKPSVEELLALFATICDAVMYAHQRGIIHRDLKPSNILVDANGEPKVLDFGLAKQMASPSVTLVSVTGQVFGTLPYMSPEQTGGNPEEVDTRTDIYALGVVLYQLLTGRYPYPIDGQLAEVIQHITQTAPTPPTRQWSLESGITRRSTGHLKPGECPIDNEVQTIVLKALAKERERRYQSAAELARDLRHYLANEPIEAKRDSTWYVLRKTISRHKTPFVMAAGLVLLAIGSAIALSVMYSRQSSLLVEVQQQRDRAVEAEAHAGEERDKALRAEGQAARQRDRAVLEEKRAAYRFAQVRALAKSFIYDFSNMIADLPGSLPARELLVTKALKYLDSLAKESQDDIHLQDDLAAAYLQVGQVQWTLGDVVGANKSYQAALDIAEAIDKVKPEELYHRFRLAGAHRSLGIAYQNQGRIAESRDHFLRALQIRQALLAEKPEDKDRRLRVVIARRHLAGLSAAEGAFQDALAECGRAIALCEAVAEDHPEDSFAMRELAKCCEKLAYMQATLGQTKEAISARRRSVELVKALVDADPNSASLRLEWARYLHGLAGLEFTSGHYDQAIASHRLALEVRQSLSDADPRNSYLRRVVGDSHSSLAGALDDFADRRDEAMSHHQAALDAYDRALLTDPDNAYLLNAKAGTLNSIGFIFFQQGRLQDALLNHQKALALIEPLCAAHAEFKRGHSKMGRTLTAIANIHTKQGRSAEALDLSKRAVAIQERLSKAEPDNINAKLDYASAIFTMGRAYSAQGDFLRGTAAFAKSLKLGYSISMSDPESRLGRLDLQMKRELNGLLSSITDAMRSGKKKKAEKNDKPARRGSTQPARP